MNRIWPFIVASIITAAVTACSGTSQISRQPVAAQDSINQSLKTTPEWFSTKTIQSDSSAIRAYATAIGSDSAAAASKAADRARMLLERSVSDKLEATRARAVKKLGNDSGLADPDFLIALRKADNDIQPLLSTARVAADAVKGQKSMRGFAEVHIDRAALIDHLGNALSGHQQTWTTLVQSEAFSNF